MISYGNGSFSGVINYKVSENNGGIYSDKRCNQLRNLKGTFIRKGFTLMNKHQIVFHQKCVYSYRYVAVVKLCLLLTAENKGKIKITVKHRTTQTTWYKIIL